MGRSRRALIAAFLFLASWNFIGCFDEGGTQDPATPPPPSTSLRLEQLVTGLSSPVFLTAPPNDLSRLFIVEQGGLIRIFSVTTSSLLATAFLDISGLVLSGGERGLLGMAFDPNYGTNGRFYVFYTDLNGTITIARYVVTANPDLANAASQNILVSIPHPNFANHNGGMLAFGPDGCLYIGVGDGGSGGDPNNNAQNQFSLLGKLLRLNPDTGAACGNVVINPFLLGGGAQEIWSLGLRNPWRFSFDRQSGDLYIGDVGQNLREEIDVSPAPSAGRGLNYGWRFMEGFLCFNPATNCNAGNLTLPVLDYPHMSGACSVTGGYVYRGLSSPALQGTYFYADFCAGFVRSFRFQNVLPTNQLEWPLLRPPGGFITSFGEDALGELYLVTQGGGLFKIVPN
jgi:glucose/arabinose dehydrogenase